jgi:hypothetical protein
LGFAVTLGEYDLLRLPASMERNIPGTTKNPTNASDARINITILQLQIDVLSFCNLAISHVVPGIAYLYDASFA